jgi:OmpA-OmpF porin, OOP family
MKTSIKYFRLLALLFTVLPAFLSAQELEFDAPVKLPETINSEAEESQPIVTNDGQKLFFNRTFHEKNEGGKFAGHDIWISVKDENGNWTDASNKLGKLNNKRNNAVVGISADGQRIYLLDTYHALKSGEKGISYSDAAPRGHRSKPLTFGIKGLETQTGFIGFYMHPSEEVLIIAMADERSLGKEDLYVSLKNAEGEWSEPLHMGQQLNTQGFEIAPFLSEDKKMLFFTSDGHKGLGDADVFVSRRLDNNWTNWSAPENLGAPVNSEAFDGYFFVTSANDVYFASNREGRFSAIYSTEMRVKEQVDEALVASTNEAKTNAEELKQIAQISEATLKPSVDELFRKNFQQLVVFFDFDSEKIGENTQDKLTELAQNFRDTKAIDLLIIGHTDQSGTETYNQKLSLKRAERVKAFLVSLGIDVNKILIEGKGESELLNEASTEEAKQQNRRVEIKID